MRDPAVAELPAKTSFINRLQQARAKAAMHPDAQLDDSRGQRHTRRRAKLIHVFSEIPEVSASLC
jgi:hypothetical protein